MTFPEMWGCPSMYYVPFSSKEETYPWKHSTHQTAAGVRQESGASFKVPQWTNSCEFAITAYKRDDCGDS